MTTSFADHFWGEKNHGFFVLYHNMKYAQTSSKEFIEFLRESSKVEESYSNLLNRLAKVASNSSQIGTFAPFWGVIKTLAEKLSTLHSQLVHTWTELIKDVVRYNEEQHKRHKSMKESESGTSDAVHTLQNTVAALQRAKEGYHAKSLELERLKRDGASIKDVEKCDTKRKKSHDDYKGLLEKYEKIRNVFDNKMTESCHHFQELEEEHICQMKDFIDTYARAWENEHALMGQVHNEFKGSCDELTVQKLLETFIGKKKTGIEKAGPIEFVEPDLSSLPPGRPMSPDPNDNKRDSIPDKLKPDSGKISDGSGFIETDQLGPLSRSVKLRVSRTWFLKTRKKKEKKKKKKDSKDGGDDKDKDNESLDADAQDPTTPEVDEEGYTIRPENINHNDKTSWDSSDSETDSDDEIKRKFRVEIRPLSPTGVMPSGNVDDIKASVEGLRLSPSAGKKRSQTPVDKKLRRSKSDALDLDDEPPKPSQDLNSLDLFLTSGASTTTGGKNFNLPSPISPQVDSVTGSRNQSAVTTPLNNSEVMSLFNNTSSSDVSSLSSLSSASQTNSIPSNSSTSSLSTVIPRPPSRNRGGITQGTSRPAGRCSPITCMSRSESIDSVRFTTSSMTFGSSRGPSPLTLGMSDVVPLAVAFTESVNAYFKGTDATKGIQGESSEDIVWEHLRCMVKITGNLMMSFPAGVAKVFTENPTPAVLSFKIKNAKNLEQICLNNSLLSRDMTQEDSSEDYIYIFDMPALTEHLRCQAEQNKVASYFNVDILKYQVQTSSGVESTPLPLIAYWKCDNDKTDFRLDYKYNGSAMNPQCPLKNVQVAVNVSGGVTHMQSIPNGHWDADLQRGSWKLEDISEVSENGSQGYLRAKFDLDAGPSAVATTAVQFLCDGATLSGVEFELNGSGYRISLAKKRFATGKYLVDPDSPDVKYNV